MSNTTGNLYVVATPIGNLEDMTPRAVRILSEADLIAAEDTRHSAKLLHHFGIKTELVSVHEHNELDKLARLIALLHEGKCIALVSDAGTPLISDPGYHFVRAARAAGARVVPVPGACAAVAALSVAGLPMHRFAFEGFPPMKATARRSFFHNLKNEARTLVFYESPHRIVESLKDMVDEFGQDREAVLARELTKKFETLRGASLVELSDWVGNDKTQQRGEFVVLIHGAQVPKEQALNPEAERILRLLLKELSVKEASALAAEITGLKKNQLYRYALQLTS